MPIDIFEVSHQTALISILRVSGKMELDEVDQLSHYFIKRRREIGESNFFVITIVTDDFRTPNISRSITSLFRSINRGVTKIYAHVPSQVFVVATKVVLKVIGANFEMHNHLSELITKFIADNQNFSEESIRSVFSRIQNYEMQPILVIS